MPEEIFTVEQTELLVKATTISNALIPAVKKYNYDVILEMGSVAIDEKETPVIIAWVAVDDKPDKQVAYAMIEAYRTLPDSVQEIGLDIRYYKKDNDADNFSEES